MTPPTDAAHAEVDAYRARREAITAEMARVEPLLRDGLGLPEIRNRLLASGTAPDIADSAIEAAVELADAAASQSGQPIDPQNEEFAARAVRMHAWYDSARQEFIRRNQRGAWQHLKDTALKQELAMAGVPIKPAEGESVSEAQRFLSYLRNNRDVDYSGPLAGRAAGLYTMAGYRALVTVSPSIPEPAATPRSFPLLAKLIDGMFCEPDAACGVSDQTPYLYGWLAWGYRALRTGQVYPGQALAVAGPRECGKSLLQQVVTVVLGGRSAKPYQYMIGATPFNSDLFRAEHLMIEDECASTDRRARRAFGAQLKQVCANVQQRCHPKGREPIMLEPFWRLTITLNDEAENLMILPPLDDSIEDKIIILLAHRRPMPMPCSSPTEKDAFWSAIMAEIPALCRYLLDYQVPPDLASTRYGVREYHHPAILNELYGMSPEFQLLQMVDAVLFPEPRAPWQGSAEELAQILKASDSPVRHEAVELLHWPSACGTYLARLAKKHPDRFEYRRLGSEGRRTWKLASDKLAT
jgi:hypothetical protein